MKKILFKLTGAAFFLLMFVSSCTTSVKGKWTDEDKQKFRKEMEGITELSNFGENKTEWIECYLSKCEANYSSFAEADSDEAGCERIAYECNDEVLSNGSVQGNWSQKDKETFRAEMEGIDALSNFGDNKSAWIECYLSNCEANYASFYHANMDQEGCEKIAVKCTEEFN